MSADQSFDTDFVLTDAHLALQIGDKNRITTPVNWKKGDDVIVHPSVSNDEAKDLFPEHTVHLPYLRTTPLKV